VTDPLLVNGSGASTITGGPVASLLSGLQLQLLSGITLTRADINTGSRSNQATAAGTPPSGADVTDLSDDVVT
jgi:hypothetical protein